MKYYLNFVWNKIVFYLIFNPTHLVFLAFNFNTHNIYIICIYILIHFYVVTDVVVSLPMYLRNLSSVMLFFRFNNETGVKLA